MVRARPGERRLDVNPRRITNRGFPRTQPQDHPQTEPALLEHARERAKSRENRFADRVTALSGSMRFVYIHVIWFGCWIGFGIENYPCGLLTMVVSLSKRSSSPPSS